MNSTTRTAPAAKAAAPAARSRRDAALLALAAAGILAVVVAPELAHAQAVGGGGGANVITQITTWFMTNVARGAVMLGLLAVGLGMLFMRFSAQTVGMVVVGGMVLANADTLAGYFGF